MLFFRLSIRLKFILTTTLAVLLTILFAFFYYPAQQKRQLSDTFVERLQSTSELIALSTGVALGLDSYSAIQETFDWMQQDSTIIYVLLYDSDGEMFAEFNPKKTLLNREILLARSDVYQENSVLHGSMPILFQGNDYGRLLIGYSLTPMFDRVSKNTNTGLYIGLTILALGILFSWVFGHLITKPINALRNAATEMANGNTDIRLDIKSPDEVGDLARAFDIMVKNINEAVSSLEESEERFRNVTESAADAIVGVNEHSIIAFWNNAATEIYGYSEQEAVGKDMVDLLIPERFHDQAIAYLKTYFDTKSNTDIRRSIHLFSVRKNGSEFPAELHVSRIQIGGKWHLTGILRDVTKQKKSEVMHKVLYEIANAYGTSDSLDALFKTIHELLGKVISTSNFYIAFYDKDSELLSFPYYVDEADQAPETKPLGRGLTEFVLREVQSVFLNKDDIYTMSEENIIDLVGTPSEQFVSVPLCVNEEAIGVVTVQSYDDPKLYSEDDLALLEYVSAQIADAIVKRRNADALRASEQKHRKLSFELTQSNGMKDLLLDIITHDLKNPAGVIHGVADMLTKDDPDNELVHMIKGSSDNLLKVISNATTLSKVSMDEEIKKEDLYLHDLIKDILFGFKSALTHNDILASNNVPEDQIIHANPIIEEVFKNYISNAIKYAAHGKEIVVDCELSNNFIDIFVKDLGTTIAEDKRESIFIRNLQLGDTKGRGLGLAIVKRIAESHGGSVWATQNEPTGNIFAVRLHV